MNIKKDWFNVFALTFSIIILRNCMEMFLKREGVWNFTQLNDWVGWWFHFPLFYFTLWISASIGLTFLINVSFLNSLKIISNGMLIILVGPIVDFFTATGSIPYLYVKKPEFLAIIFTQLLNPFKNLLQFGIPIGPRVEVFLALLFATNIIWKKVYSSINHKISKILQGLFFTYLGIFLLCTWPAFLNALLKNSELLINDMLYSKVYLLIIVSCSGIAILHSNNRNKIILFFFLRPKRFLHYLILTLAGILLSCSNWQISILHDTRILPNEIVGLVSGLVCLLLIFISSTILNDYTDQIEDIKNNRCFFTKYPELKNRTLNFGAILFIAAILLAFACNSNVLNIVLIWSALTVIYSIPPMRLKRFIIVSNFIIAFSAVLAVFFGFYITGSAISFNILSKEYIVLVFLISFLGSFIKDLPDVKGDKIADIITLPSLLSPLKYSLVYLLILIICYTIAILIVAYKSSWAYILIIPAIVSLYSIVKFPNKNNNLFISYYISLIIVTIIYMIQ